MDGILTLYDASFQKTCISVLKGKHFYRIQLGHKPDFKFELFPLHSPLLRESLLVSFPPLIDMLKFSG
jgi:hypothetical protein